MQVSLTALRAAAADPNYPVSRLIRDAIAVALRTKSNQFVDYLKLERDGYDEKSELPDYRWMHGSPTAKSRFGWSPFILQDFDQDVVTRRPVPHGVSEIEDYLMRSKAATVIMPYPPSVVDVFREHVPDLIEAGVEVPVAQFRRLLEAVRNRIFDFAFSIAEDTSDSGVMEIRKSEGVQISEQDQRTSTQVIFNIENLHGAAGSISNSNLQINDFSNIHRALKDAGVPQQARNELENIVDEANSLEPDERPRLASRARQWLDRNKSFLLTSTIDIAKLLHELKVL